jgi:phosphonatase-like hydrolase
MHAGTELDLVVLDMAGTTIADQGQVPSAMLAALKAHGLTLSSDELTGVRGSSKREAIRSLVGPHRTAFADAVYVTFRGELVQRYAAAGVQPIAGAAAVIRDLRARGVRVALNTGFDRETAMLLLEAVGWADGIVDAVVCGDDVRRGRPAPYLIHRAMETTGVTSVFKVANVGDTTLDLWAGHNAGVRWNIAVLSGAHDRGMLAGAPGTHIIESLADLASVWDPPAAGLRSSGAPFPCSR